MNTTHPSFPQPADPDIPVWRYMSFEKIASLLTSGQLYFSRSDKLGDSHEGTITEINAGNIHSQFCDPNKPELIIKVRTMHRLITYINCWHMNYDESDAMWKLYCGWSKGVAIQTTYRELSQAIIDSNVYLGCVRYIDYQNESIPLGNMFNIFMYKRKAFQHENEVRLIKQIPLEIKSVETEFNEENVRKINPLGINVTANLGGLIKHIYVNPYASDQYYKEIRSTVEKYLPTAPVVWSRLRAVPRY